MLCSSCCGGRREWTQPFFEVDSYRTSRSGWRRRAAARRGHREGAHEGHAAHRIGGGARAGRRLDDALRKALTNDYPELEHIELEDYRVRVLAETHGPAPWSAC